MQYIHTHIPQALSNLEIIERRRARTLFKDRVLTFLMVVISFAGVCFVGFSSPLTESWVMATFLTFVGVVSLFMLFFSLGLLATLE